MMNIDERLTRLERQNRRLWMLVGVLAVGATAMGAASTHDLDVRTLTAQKIRLVDADGALRAMLALDGDAPALVLRHGDSVARLAANSREFNNDGAPTLWLQSGDKKVATMSSNATKVNEEGGPTLWVGVGRTRAAISATAELSDVGLWHRDGPVQLHSVLPNATLSTWHDANAKDRVSIMARDDDTHVTLNSRQEDEAVSLQAIGLGDKDAGWVQTHIKGKRVWQSPLQFQSE